MQEKTTVRKRNTVLVQSNSQRQQLFFQHWGIGFAVGCICYAFLFLNHLTNHNDGIWISSVYMPGEWELSLGRWLLGLLSVVRVGYAGDPFNSLLTIALIALSNTFVFLLFDVLSSKKTHLYAAMIMCSATVCAFLSYRFTSPMYGFSYLLAVLSIYALQRSKNPAMGFLLAAVCICCGLAFYQTSIGCACLIVIILGIKECVDEEVSIKSVLYKLLWRGIALALGCVMYYVIWKVIMQIEGVAASDYKGAETVSLKNIITNLPNSVVHAYREFIRFFFKSDLKQSIFQAKPIGFVLYMLVAAGVMLATIAAMRKSIVRGLLFIAFALVVPVACNFTVLLVQESALEMQMTAPLCMLIPMMLLALDISLAKLLRGKWLKVSFKVLLGAAVLFLYGNVYQITIDMNVMYEGRRATETLVQNIMSTMMNDGLYEENQEIVLAGLPCENPTYRKSALWNDCNQYARFGQWWEGVNSQRSYRGILRRLGIHAIAYLADDENEYARFIEKNDDFIRKMPLYPDEGSMEKIGNTLIVKVSNSAYAQGHEKSHKDIDRQPVLGAWYDIGFAGSESVLHITTRPDIEFLKAVSGETELGSWQMSDVQMIEYPEHECKDWIIPYVFDAPGTYDILYQTSYDGIHYADHNETSRIEISMPYVQGVRYEAGETGQPTHIYVTTRDDIGYLEMWLNDNELVKAEANTAVIEHNEANNTCEWKLEYTFEYPGVYDLWYRASIEGENYRPFGFENMLQITDRKSDL